MNINAALSGLGNLAKGLTGLGLAVIPTALVVDVLFPGQPTLSPTSATLLKALQVKA